MRNKYTKDIIQALVKNSKSWADVCRKVGVKPATGTQTHLTRRAKAFGIDTSHFTGQGWSKGKEFPEQHKPLKVYLVKDSSVKSSFLKERLIKEGFKKRECERCNLSKWKEEPIPLELHHKDSDHWNNELDNLEILCPNCHTQVTLKCRRTPSGERTDLGSVEAKAVAGSIPVAGTKHCITCNKEISSKAKKCKRCTSRSQSTKIDWPSKEELLSLLSRYSYLQVGKKLGVSDNAIRKHLKIIKEKDERK